VLERIALGCGNFGGIGSAPELFGRGESDEEASRIMDAAWELGIRRFDTADAYGGGRSETAIGKWIATTGNRPAVTTKTFNPMDTGEDHGLAPDRVRRQLELSLGRLGVESVELYLAHDFDPRTPLAETFGAFEELLASGKIEAYGVSNFEAAQLREALATGSPSAVQNSYSLLDRSDAAQVLPLCADHGLSYQAFSPLAGGWLSGKYRRDAAVPAGSRMTMRPEPYRHLETDSVYDGLEALAAGAAKRGVSMAAIALAWLLADPHVSVVIVGPRRPEHLEPVREALGLDLAGERDALPELFP
jgi:aryl-alcohol dehydrogenase-like predicted oxidoreductase